MRKFLVIALITVFACPAFAGEEAAAPIDFSQALLGPSGKPDLAENAIPCPVAKPDCWKEWTLGYTAYAALCSSQRDPRNPAGTDPDEAKRCALGWRIFGAAQTNAPMVLTTDEKSMLKASLFRSLTVPALAYGACRMIVPPAECEK